MPAGASREPGTSVRAVVLDANKREGVVDLSLQPRLVAAAQAAAAAADAETAPKKKKQKKAAVGGKAAAAAELKEGQRLECKVELVSCDAKELSEHSARSMRCAGAPAIHASSLDPCIL